MNNPTLCVHPSPNNPDGCLIWITHQSLHKQFLGPDQFQRHAREDAAQAVSEILEDLLASGINTVVVDNKI